MRTPDADKPLTELDARILEGIANGESNVQLAGRLHLSRQGIEYRVAALLRKLQAPNRTALIARAYTLGLFGKRAWPPKVRSEFVR
ncbi:response regulator transcription factor [Umezawaea endophytica]|uniref:LuxR C-terminal-related transcriptional regulator n=1 Tax=Umezawaea endophytica TaxID=1654476 RepID=A0A9X2VKH3_9PSEU|nr:LuxR C-terminal-related transcriptional regulator [Umezawaea endophytica]MCS7476813.1 LuxR C-terminal-related transcriptional regulator [Umezawaea endophytica]